MEALDYSSNLTAVIHNETHLIEDFSSFQDFFYVWGQFVILLRSLRYKHVRLLGSFSQETNLRSKELRFLWEMVEISWLCSASHTMYTSMEYSVNMLKRENRICGIESNEQLCHAKENPSSLGLNRDQKHRGFDECVQTSPWGELSRFLCRSHKISLFQSKISHHSTGYNKWCWDAARRSAVFCTNVTLQIAIWCIILTCLILYFVSSLFVFLLYSCNFHKEPEVVGYMCKHFKS